MRACFFWLFAMSPMLTAESEPSRANTHLNRESLYRMLSKSGNPSLDSLAAVLNGCGLRLAIQPVALRRGKRRIA